MDELTKNFFTVLTSLLFIVKFSASEEVLCDTLPSVPNARPENATPPFKLGRGVKYFCNKNYKANGGTLTAMCEINDNELASFTEPSAICGRVGCGNIPKLTMISPVNPGNEPFSLGTRINYVCDIGMRKLGGTTVALCTELAPDTEPEWVLPTLTCMGVSCEDPGESPHATRKGTLFTFPNNVTYTCDEGYKMVVNRPTIFCLANKEWSASVPKCEIITCPVLPPISNGVITYSETDQRYQSVAEYRCNHGFKLNSSENKRKCSSQGMWDGLEPFCGEVQCSPIFSVANGHVVYNANATQVEDLVIIRCNPPDPSKQTLRCRPDGTWSDTLLVCRPPHGDSSTTSKPVTTTEVSPEPVGPAIPCEDPGVIENGHLIDKIIFPTNQTIVYGCKEGFTISGTGKLTCQRDGTWSPGTMPKCKKRLAIEIIAGIAVGVVSLLILVVLGVIYYLKKKKNNSIGSPGLKNKALSVDAKNVDEIRHLDKDKKPIPVTSL